MFIEDFSAVMQTKDSKYMTQVLAVQYIRHWRVFILWRIGEESFCSHGYFNSPF